MTEQDPSVRDTDKLVNLPSPKKTFIAGYQPRNETRMIICRNCGTLHEGDRNTPCPVCTLTDNQDMKKYTKYKLSSDQSDM